MNRIKNNQIVSTFQFSRKKSLMLQSIFSPIRSLILVTALLILVPVIVLTDIARAQEASDVEEMEDAFY